MPKVMLYKTQENEWARPRSQWVSKTGHIQLVSFFCGTVSSLVGQGNRAAVHRDFSKSPSKEIPEVKMEKYVH